jgi:hypothetical protein
MLTAKVSRVSFVIVLRNVLKNAFEALLDRHDIFRGSVAVTTATPDARRAATAEGRQQWFVDQLRKGKPLRRADLEDEFGISLATAKRNLIALQPWVSFDRAEGTYRRRKTAPRP